MADEPLQIGLIGGTEKREIKIFNYDRYWPKKFETHARTIAAALGDSALCIEHIGSTSVPGLAAKPIIDILVVVVDSADESVYLPQVEAAGYVLRVRSQIGTSTGCSALPKRTCTSTSTRPAARRFRET